MSISGLYTPNCHNTKDFLNEDRNQFYDNISQSGASIYSVPSEFSDFPTNLYTVCRPSETPRVSGRSIRTSERRKPDSICENMIYLFTINICETSSQIGRKSENTHPRLHTPRADILVPKNRAWYAKGSLLLSRQTSPPHSPCSLFSPSYSIEIQ